MWCIFEGLAPKPQQHGRTCNVPIVKQSAYQKHVFSSFSVQGAMLFNCIPKDIRALTNCEKSVFKKKLDKFLKTIPDEPQICGYTAYRRAETNSLLDMVEL